MKLHKNNSFLSLVVGSLLLPLCVNAVQIDPADYECTFNVKFVGYRGTSTLADFPVLIRLSKALNGFNYAKCAGGANLRFADSDGNMLMHEIDTWDASGESLVWVKVPSLTKETVIKVLYGYKGAGEQPAVTASDVWSNGYVGVWHLGESALPMKESSGVSTGFTSAGGSGIVYASAGKIGKAVDFSGGNSSARLIADDDDDLDGFVDCTFEVWTKQDAAPDRSMGIFEKRKSSKEDNSYYIYNNHSSTAPTKDGRNVFTACTNGTEGVTYPVGTGSNMMPVWGQWCHQVFVRDATGTHRGFGYVNGTKSGTVTQKTDPIYASAQPLHLGNNHSGAQFGGSIDEARISNVARSEDWVNASYDTVAGDGFAVFFATQNDWSSYSHRFTVSFDGYAGETTLTDFPVLVRVAEYDEASGTGIQGFHYSDCALVGGGDIRFADANGQMLAHEIDTWDANGESLVWVKVPTLSSTTTITAYYGWNLAPIPSSPESVWANGYVGVWHMDEGTRMQSDSTASGKTMEGYSTYAENMVYGVDGAVGKAVEQAMPLDADGKYRGGFKASDSGGLYNGTKTLTVEAWACHRDIVNDKYIVRNKTGSTLYSAQLTYKSNDPDNTKLNYSIALTNLAAGTGTVYSGLTYSMPTNEVVGAWRHYALVIDNATLHSVEAYQNGVSKKSQVISDADEALVGGSGFLTFGNTDNGGSQAFPGSIDEMRVSNVARSADWIKATHDTIKNNATFTTYGTVKEIIKGLSIIIR